MILRALHLTAKRQCLSHQSRLLCVHEPRERTHIPVAGKRDEFGGVIIRWQYHAAIHLNAPLRRIGSDYFARFINHRATDTRRSPARKAPLPFPAAGLAATHRKIRVAPYGFTMRLMPSVIACL